MNHPSTFQTCLPAIAVGSAMHGGFFAGFIVSGSTLCALVVAPKAAGQVRGVWHPSRPDVPGATSCHDGPANTLAMAEAGSELAQRILQLDIDGFRDWYLPARDELELLYRAFKPGLQPNVCTWRDGDNASSVPVAYPYTPDVPAQTPVPAFQAGGAEAFDLDWYWSSTQVSRDGAYGQGFGGGSQYGDIKSAAGLARAVRRFNV